MQKKIVIVGVVVTLIVVITAWQWLTKEEHAGLTQQQEISIQKETNNQINNQVNMNNTKAPEMTIDTSKTYQAVLKTGEGDITVEFTTAETPITVNNFITLARENFYDNTVFHRVMKGFMIQGGDPQGDGTGGPGYRFADEQFEGDYDRGVIAMANAGPDTNGSQFFIMHKDYPLPHNYVIFGKVIDGLDVVDTIATSAVEQSVTGEMSKPKVPVVVESVEIIEK